MKIDLLFDHEIESENIKIYNGYAYKGKAIKN